VRYLLGSVAMILLSISAALAADPSGTAGSDSWRAVSPPAPALTALGPASVAMPAPTAPALRPVRLARAPLYTLSTASLLPAESQAIGFRTSGNRAGGGMSHHVQWAIAGAAI